MIKNMRYLALIVIVVILYFISSCGSKNRGLKATSYEKCFIKSTRYNLERDSICYGFYQNARAPLCLKMYKIENEYKYFIMDTLMVYFTDDTINPVIFLDSLRKYFEYKQLPDKRYQMDDPTAVLVFIVDKNGNVLYKGGTVGFSHYSEEGMVEILDAIDIKFEPYKINGISVCSEIRVFVDLHDIKWKRWKGK